MILSLSSEKFKAQSRTVFTVSSVDTGSSGNGTRRELRIRANCMQCEYEYNYQFREQLNNSSVWLSLFHLAQRGTREEQLVFRQSSHRTSHWVTWWHFGSINRGIGDWFQKFYTQILTYSECVRHLNYAPRKAHFFLSGSTLFSPLSHKSHNFVKNLLNGVFVFCSSQQICSRTFFILRSYLLDLIKTVYRSSSAALIILVTI
jgi:hypothetical protein